MTKTLTRIYLSVVIAVSTTSLTTADIAISMSLDQSGIVDSGSIQEGTGLFDVFLHFDSFDGPAGNHTNASFTGFFYGVEATNTGVALPAFAKPITAANLSALLQNQNWNVFDQSGAGAPNQLAGNVVAPGGMGVSAPFGGMVMAFGIDTSNLVAGDTIVFDPNLFGLAEVSNGLDTFGGNANYVFNQAVLTVTGAIPEPGSAIIVLAFGLAYTSRRTVRETPRV